jgi:hypothetical protein
LPRLHKDFQNALFFQSAEMLMASFAGPRMSRILESTDQFYLDFNKRAADQFILGGMMRMLGTASGPGQAAVGRVNAMHNHYNIHPNDFIFIGCEIAVTPIRQAQQYGWRPVANVEIEASARSASELAASMNIAGFLDTFEKQQTYYDHYLNTMLHFEHQNRTLSDQLIAYFTKIAPEPILKLMPGIFFSIVDTRIVKACGYDLPPVETVAKMRSAMKEFGRNDPVGDDVPNPLERAIAEKYPRGPVAPAEIGTYPEGLVRALK